MTEEPGPMRAGRDVYARMPPNGPISTAALTMNYQGIPKVLTLTLGIPLDCECSVSL